MIMEIVTKENSKMERNMDRANTIGKKRMISWIITMAPGKMTVRKVLVHL